MKTKITILQPPAGAGSLPATESIVVVVQGDQQVPLGNASYLFNGSRPAGGRVAMERFDDGRIVRLLHTGVPLLESAVQAAGPYGWEPTALVDVESKSMRSALPPAPRFYRLRLMGGIDIPAPRIESIGLEPGSVVITYGH
jgi:hypothetical protein